MTCWPGRQLHPPGSLLLAVVPALVLVLVLALVLMPRMQRAVMLLGSNPPLGAPFRGCSACEGCMSGKARHSWCVV